MTVIVNQLDKKLRGLVLSSLEYDWPKKFYWNGFSIEDLMGAKISEVRRLGKVVIIDLERKTGPAARVARGPVSHFHPASAHSKQKSFGGQKDNVSLRAVGNPSTTATPHVSILIHLKLTGQLIYQDQKTRISGGHPIPPLNLPVPNKTTRATFTFTNGGHLYFNDMRKFGWVKIVTGDKEHVTSAIGELGPDPLVMSYGEFRQRLQKKPQARVKKLLMDQTFISGVGNIYSDEALWRAKVHPKRSVVSLTDVEIRAIYEGIRDSFKLAISKGGSSANAFVDSGGEKGLYLSYARAYHMTGKPCARCKAPIIREKMDSRSAHFCPNCQRLK